MTIKPLAAAAAIAAALLAVACSKETENTRTDSYDIPAYTLFTGEAGDVAYQTPSNYIVLFTQPAFTMSLAVNGLVLPDNTSVSFESEAVPTVLTYVPGNDQNNQVFNFGPAPVPGAAPIQNLRCTLTQAVNNPNVLYKDAKVPGYTYFVPNQYFTFGLFTFDYDGWKARTFWCDYTFTGETMTSYPGMEEPFLSGTIGYRVVLQRHDVDKDHKNLLSGKGDVIIYNAAFAPAMQGHEIAAIVVKDLDLQYSPEGLLLSAENAVPMMIEGGELQEMPRFKFDSLKVRVGGATLTDAAIDFSVAGVYQGSFTGSCLISVPEGK